MEGRKERRILAGNISWSFMAKMAAMVLFFPADILAARILGVEEYAQWSFFYAMLTMLFYLEWFGVNASAKVFVSKAETPSQRRTVLTAGLKLRREVSILISLLILAAGQGALSLPAAGGLGAKYPQLRLLLLMAPAVTFLNSYTEYFKEIFVGLMTYGRLFAVTVTEYGGYLLFGTFGALVLRNASGVCCGYIVTGAVVLAAGMKLVPGALKEKADHRTDHGRTDQDRADPVPASVRETKKEIFSYAIPLALIGIGGMILTEMDTLMLGALCDKGQVASYAIAKQICTKASHINNILATGSLTMFAVIRREEYALRRKQFSRLSRLNFLVTVLAAAALFLLGGTAIRILYSGDYAQAGGIIRMLSFYYLLYGISAFYALFLDFRKKAGMRSVFYLLMIVLNFAGNWILIPRYGAAGAAAATGISLIPYTVYVTAASYILVWNRLGREYR